MWIAGLVYWKTLFGELSNGISNKKKNYGMAQQWRVPWLKPFEQQVVVIIIIVLCDINHLLK